MKTKVRSNIDGWWAVVSNGVRDEHFCYKQSVRQFRAGEEYDIDRVRAFSPAREQAEEFMYEDDVPGYWEWGMDVYANHCLGCGRWAKVLAGSDRGGWSWRVTECGRCGMLDSRLT